MTYNKHIKKISNNIEKSLTTFFQSNGLKAKSNNSHGIDLILEKHIFIEIKSCRKFIRHSERIRYGAFSFKKNEFKQNIDYYIFVLKINSTENLDYIKKYDVFIIDKHQIVKMIKRKQILTHNRTNQTYYNLKKLKYQSLDNFLKKIKEN